MTPENIWHFSLAAVILWAVCCRLNAMGAGTKHSISFMYMTLGFLVSWSLTQPTTIELLSVLMYTSTILMFDAPKWKSRQPLYTIEPSKRRIFA